MAYSDSKNPFYIDDKDDFAFSQPVNRGYQPASSKNPFLDEDEFGGRPLSRYEQLQKMKENSMNNQLDSTQRALSSIYQSEQMGVATAEELLQQGEQLSNTETRLDKINQDMKVSQKHLNSIKSIFGGIKNWWQGKDKLTGEPSQPQKATSEPAPSLKKALDTSLSSGVKAAPHPALALKTEDGRGFYEDDEDLDSKFLGTGSRLYNEPSAAASKLQQKQVIRSGLVAADEKLDQNLDMMCEGMMRLKGLAKGLGEEIDQQNEQIDRITGKADRADIKLKDQNRQMRQILR